MELENTNIHLKSEKQLKMCDPKIFSAFVHRNELPIMVIAYYNYGVKSCLWQVCSIQRQVAFLNMYLASHGQGGAG